MGVGTVPGSLPSRRPVPSLRHLLGDAQSRAVRCPLRILCRRSEVPGVPTVRIPASAPPSAATHPGSPARRACLPGGWLSAHRRRLLRFSSAVLHRSERHVPGLRGRTPGNYYGLGRGKGGGGQREGVGGRAAAFYSPPKPPPATEHAQLPGFAPRRTFHERTQLFRVFAAAGGRQALSSCGREGKVGGVSARCGAPSHGKQPFASAVPQLPSARAGAPPAPPFRNTRGSRSVGQDQCGAELCSRGEQRGGRGRG